MIIMIEYVHDYMCYVYDDYNSYCIMYNEWMVHSSVNRTNKQLIWVLYCVCVF